MTWMNRLRLFFGVIAVTALVVLLTVALSHRKGETASASAAMTAVEYPVGTDYAGTVVEQFVVPGDRVAVGDPIARIQSTQLLNDLENDIAVPDSAVAAVNADGTLTVHSSVDGLVREVVVPQGGYASGGSTVALVAALESLAVAAEFVLDRRDFERIETGARVEVILPNDTTLPGAVETVEVETVEGRAVATVTVDIDETEFGQHGGLMTPGTPVEAVMHLRNDDLLASSIGALRRVIDDVRAALL